MPRLSKKKLPRLTAEELKTVVIACNVRDKAIVLFMADSGLRRAEVVNLNWGDVNILNGLVRVLHGKGRKFRSAAIGAKTRRVLLAYRRTIENHSDSDPLFQTRTGERFKGAALLLVFRRLSKRKGIHCTPHAMRRTYTILALRAGWDALHVQRQLGHNSLTMTENYASLEDEDLLEAAKHSPVDNL